MFITGFKVRSFNQRKQNISKDQAFSDCIVIGKDAFDPDAVFLDDIVDDEVLPRLNLTVDGLTGTNARSRDAMELHPRGAANEPLPATNSMPNVTLDPEQLEVYGWETSFWRKIRGYLGF
ncbi:MAG TPA: hypothetical protein VF389_07975 [Woeseiaceae bacterium]